MTNATLKKKEEKLLPRPPIVAVMGHVDHGKTSLLDYIRRTNMAAREAGGITQSIGAYEIKHNDKKITFIDTPGHEAFFKMRERGAQAADVAILVVAADDGVQPQTKECIDILQKTSTPFIAAINKIDKSNADVEKTKNSLSASGVYLEGYGGSVSWQEISAKKGEGINELLDLILLAAEIENLTYNSEAAPRGVIIEAKMDSRRGITVTGIIKNGVLKSGDKIATSAASGKIKILEDFQGNKAEQLEPSSPFLVLGFESLPLIGEEFIAGDVELETLDIAGARLPEVKKKAPAEVIAADAKKPMLNLILKADVGGSLEALGGIIRALPQEKVGISILSEEVGEISDSNVRSAEISGAVIIGFNVKVSRAADTLAKAQKIKIITSPIIYELVKSTEEEMKFIENPLPLGEAEILALFSQKGKQQLLGGKVLTGFIKNNTLVKIQREGTDLGNGRIVSLQSQKKQMTQVEAPNEFGVMVESSIAIAVKDKLVYFKN